MTISFKNNAVANLSTSIDDADTSIAIEAADWVNFMSGRAAGTEFYCTLISATGREIVKVDVDASSEPVLSVSRGQEGTIAQGWARSTVIYQDMTTETLASLQQTTEFRKGSVNPNNTITSLYFGEKFYDEIERLWWKAVAAGTQEWRLIAGEVFVNDVTFDPVPGTYNNGQALTMECLTAGADIYYTDDGTDPDQTDTLYTIPVVMPSDTTTTYKARGFGSERWEQPSQNITTGVYTLEEAGPQKVMSTSLIGGQANRPHVWNNRVYTGDLVIGSTVRLWSWASPETSWTVEEDTAVANNPSVRSITNSDQDGTDKLYIYARFATLLKWNDPGYSLVTVQINTCTCSIVWVYSGAIYAHVCDNSDGNDYVQRWNGSNAWVSQYNVGRNIAAVPTDFGGQQYFCSQDDDGLYRHNGSSYSTIVTAPGTYGNRVQRTLTNGTNLYGIAGSGSGYILRWNGASAWVQEYFYSADGWSDGIFYNGKMYLLTYDSGITSYRFHLWEPGVGFTENVYNPINNTENPPQWFFIIGSTLYGLHFGTGHIWEIPEVT